MLLVRTFVGPSKIHGLGLFAAEDIKTGQKIWQFVPGIDVKIHKNDVSKLWPAAQEFLEIYAYQNQVTGDYVLCSDNDRYINHSDDPNTKNTGFGEDEGTTTAIKDIKKGEELTTNYLEFDTRSLDF